MPKSIIFSIVISLTAFAISSCTFAGNSPFRHDCDPWLNSFFERSLQERISTFSSYAHQEQYAIYLCGNQVVHPPAIYLAEPFANEGSEIVPLLKQKLTQTSQDLTIRDIVTVLAEMDRQKTYDVSGDDELMLLMTQRIADMDDQDWKRITRDKLDQISESR